MSNQPKNNEQQIEIELPAEVAEGHYSNLALIVHSHAEFIIDFIRVMPNVPKAKVKARIVMTPDHAKRLSKALHDNIRKYEQQFGEINDNGQQGFPGLPMNFSGQMGQA